MDAYNANPSSMMAALKNFVELDQEEKTVFLGDMFELGEDALVEHKNIVSWVSQQKKLTAFFCGPLFMQLEKSAGINTRFFSDTESLLGSIKISTIHPGKVMIKGSRGMRMEQCLTLFEGK